MCAGLADHVAYSIYYQNITSQCPEGATMQDGEYECLRLDRLIGDKYAILAFRDLPVPYRWQWCSTCPSTATPG